MGIARAREMYLKKKTKTKTKNKRDKRTTTAGYIIDEEQQKRAITFLVAPAESFGWNDERKRR